MGADTERPHFVPAAYLRGWADAANQVAVRRRDSATVFTPNIVNVAVDAGICGRGPLGQSREDMFNQLEQLWPSLRNTLLSHGGAASGPERDAVSMFAAIQLVRTREHVAQTKFLNSFAQYASRRPVTRDDIRAYLTERHLRFPPSNREVEGARTFACVVLNDGDPPSKDQMLSTALDIAVREIGPRLARFAWSVEQCRKPMLFKSDRPVMCWRPAVSVTAMRASASRPPRRSGCLCRRSTCW